MAVIVKKKAGRPAIRQATRDQVVELYNNDNMTCSQIAKACGISKSSVFNIIATIRRQGSDDDGTTQEAAE